MTNSTKPFNTDERPPPTPAYRVVTPALIHATPPPPILFWAMLGFGAGLGITVPPSEQRLADDPDTVAHQQRL